MANAMKNKIAQIVRLKQLVQRWRQVSFTRRPVSDSQSDAGGGCITPPGFVAVYVGPERRRFVVPTRFLNLPVFASLLDLAEEEFGLRSSGGLALPCDVVFFGNVVGFLERDEERYRGFSLDEFFRLIYDLGGFDSCKDSTNAHNVFAPLIQKSGV